MKRKAKNLTRLVRDYETSKELSPVYVKQLTYCVKRFERFLGRVSTTKDLSAKRVNRWLKREGEENQIGDRSRANLRRTIITIWRYSGRKLPLDKIRNVKVAKRNPQAWTIDEFAAVARAAESLRGKLKNGVPRALYFKAIMWFGLETGLRRRDIWTFDVREIADDGKAAIVQHKTNNSHVVQLSNATIDSIGEIVTLLQDSGSETWFQPFRWPQNEGQFYYWMRRVREIAGIDPDVANRCLQHLRRTGATQIELDGGIPWQYLGHTKEGLDRKCYVDRVKTSIVQLPKFNHDHASEPKTTP